MAKCKLEYIYGTMNSSKTANLIMTAYNYESQGRRILCLKSALDTRILGDGDSKEGVIESRAIPNPHSCELISSTDDLFNLVKQYNNEVISRYSSELSAVLVDEAQFLTAEQVRQLAMVVEKLHIDVLCYGLKNTYMDGHIFDGTAALVYYAHTMREIKTICKYCNDKATMNLRVVNGKAVYSGDSAVVIGDVVEGSDTYCPVCYHHYLNPPAPIVGYENKSFTKQSFAEKFTHIIKYQNVYGYYRKTSEIAKQGLKFTFAPSLDKKEDALKIKYVMFGPLCIDLEEFNKYREGKTQMGTQNITEAIIHFVLHFFENDIQTAFRLLKNSSCNHIKFYESKQELDNSFMPNCKEETKKRGTLKLPNGYYAYIDSHTKGSWNFYEAILTGFSMNVNNIEVGFYYEDAE